MWEFFYDNLGALGAGFVFLAIGLALLATVHTVLFKRNTRAAIGWVGVIWLAPLIGSFLYFAFGINRIRRRAQLSMGRPPRIPQTESAAALSRKALWETLQPDCEHLSALIHMVEAITKRPLLEGNRLTLLDGGEEALGDLLRSIRRAERSITLGMYIFDNDRVGKRFIVALRAAVRRGVLVRVLIDDVGSRYTWPPAIWTLEREGVPAAKFNATLVPWRFQYSNLRNHRKIAVIDGRIGYTGGMNIREGNMRYADPKSRVQDQLYRLEGPIVAHLQEAFAFDWQYTTGEHLAGEPWLTHLQPAGRALCRGIEDGPDDDFDKFRMTLLGAVSCARRTICIVTPYFLPDEALISALNTASRRGVQVEIVLPSLNNLKMVQWASNATLDQLLEHDCRIWYQPPPFDHSKLMIVDGFWTLIGSGNWDPRSLALNFEFNVEVYDRDFAKQMGDWAQRKINNSWPISQADIDAQPFAIRLRDNLARLASPYL